MQVTCAPGDVREVRVRVTAEKLARFANELVHPVYSTFALAQDAEWACRQFVLEMREPSEEGVGTYLSIEHLAPALEGSTVCIRATLRTVEDNRIRCGWEAWAGERLIARGEQEQRIVSRASFRQLVESLR